MPTKFIAFLALIVIVFASFESAFSYHPAEADSMLRTAS
jgi:hypothetical protein